MSAGPHSAKATPGPGDFKRVCERAPVFYLEAEQEFSIGIQRPRVGTFHVLLRGDSPDGRRCGLTAGPARASAEGVTHRLDHRCNRLGALGVAKQKAVHANREQLAYLPGIRLHDVGSRPSKGNSTRTTGVGVRTDAMPCMNRFIPGMSSAPCSMPMLM